jgi:hypothetical protein
MDADRDILPIGEVVGFIGTAVDLGNDNRGIDGETVFKCVVGFPVDGAWQNHDQLPESP